MKNFMFTVLAVSSFATSALAQVGIIKDIAVTGNERVEESTVESYLPLRVGDAYRAQDLSAALRALYATGLFGNVELGFDAGTLTVDVVENPLVNRIAFEGNKKLHEDRLEEVISLRPRGIYTAAKVQQDVQEILSLYRRRGRFATEVNPQLIERDQNRVDVVFSIEEGPKTRVERISFVGNSRFSDPDLRTIVQTDESAWWRFLSQSDTYDPQLMELDKEMLRRHYVEHGYADFQVVSAVAELTPEQDAFILTYTINEGPRYDFGKIGVQVNANDPDLAAESVQAEVTLEEGQIYNAKRVEENIDSIISFLGNHGFAFLDVTPEVVRDEVNRTIDLTFNVNPGPRVYVAKIDIEGNNRTRDEVIRRELRLHEGDAFSATKLQRSEDRVRRLDFFETVEVERSEGTEADRLNLAVKVAEKSTGELNLGAGYSSYEGALATASLQERNFLGRGQRVGVSFSLSEVRQNYNLNFIEPWFLNQELAAGVNLFNDEQDFSDESNFDLSVFGGGASLGWPTGEFTRNTLRLRYAETEIQDVKSDASTLVQREEGTRSGISLHNTWGIDTRDHVLTPTRGYRAAWDVGYSGFGSDIDYLSSQVSGAVYRELAEGYVFSVGARAGAIEALNDRLPIYDHFSLGGASLRGFDRRGVGPRDRLTKDALGGKYLLANNVELTFPLGGLRDLGVHGILFSDGGIVTEFDDANSDVVDTTTYRVSVGTGIYWQSPMGPLRFEFGVPVNKADEDRSKTFSFSVGTRF